MIRSSLIAVFTFIVLNGISQDIKWGALQTANKYAVFKSYLTTSSGFYMIKTIDIKKQKGIYIEKYGNKLLNQQNSVFFSNPIFQNGKTYYERVMLCNNQLHWYVSNFDRTNRKQELYKMIIDTNLNKASEPVKIDSYDLGETKTLPGYTFHSSPDKKFNLIIRKFPVDKYSNEKYYFIMHDSLLNELWKKEIEIPYANNVFEISEKIVDNAGNVHLLATIAPEKQKNELFNRSVASSKYLMISFYATENKLKEFEITLDGKYITSVTAGVNPKGNIAVGGFYSNTNTFTLAGTFYLTMSPTTKKVITLNLKPFEKEFLMEFMSERSANRGEELNDFYFDHFILNEDGSAILVAEEYYRQTFTYFDPYNQLYYDNNTFNFNSIIVVKVNPLGEIEWTKKISKRQVSSTGYNEFFSYALAKSNDQLHLFFNDHSSNTKTNVINDDNIAALTQSKFSVPVIVSLNAEGKGTKGILFKPDKNRLTLIPSVCRQIDEKTYLLYRQRRNNFQFGIINF